MVTSCPVTSAILKSWMLLDAAAMAFFAASSQDTSLTPTSSIKSYVLSGILFTSDGFDYSFRKGAVP